MIACPMCLDARSEGAQYRESPDSFLILPFFFFENGMSIRLLTGYIGHKRTWQPYAPTRLECTFLVQSALKK